MIEYVCGFMFDEKEYPNVIMIEKKRPEWQAGKLNGIGGKIEPGEHFIDAMVREFHEETGWLTTTDQWRPFANIQGKDWIVWMLAAKCKTWEKTYSITDEKVVDVNMRHLPSNVIPNLHYLIPLGWDKITRNEVESPVIFRINERLE